MDVVSSVAFSPSGDYVACDGIDGTVLFWDLLTENRKKRFGEYTDNLVRSVAFSPNGLLLGAGGVGDHHGIVWLWDVQTGKETQQFEANASDVDCVAFSPNSRLIAFGGHWGSIELRDAQTGKEIRRFDERRNIVNSIAFSPDGRWIAVGAGIPEMWPVVTVNK